MSTAHDNIQRMAFEGIPFPYESFDFSGGVRDHVHEYPHVDGGEPELLGRKLYEVRVKALFHRTFKAYPLLYPTDLHTLRGLFETKTIGKLVVPTIGTMKAYAVNWTERLAARVRSGKSVEIVFREHSLTEPVDMVIGAQRKASLTAGYEVIVEENDDPDLVSVFDALGAAVNSVTAYLDTAEMYGNLFESKVYQLKRTIEEVQRLDKLQEAENFPVYNALCDLKATNEGLLQDLLGRSGGLSTFINPETQPIQSVSLAIFGTTSRAMELLDLNPIENALSVPAGFNVRYYASAA